MADAKYRMTFNAQEIHYLHQLIKSEMRPELQNIAGSLDRYFKTFLFKLNLGTVAVSHTASQKQSLEDQLGMTDPSTRRAAAFGKFKLNPALCTPDEITLAKTYMYENNLMTEEEEREFENDAG